MNRALYYCFSFLLLLLSAGLAAQQDHVVLKNGDTIRGVVNDMRKGKLTVETYTNTVTIDESEVELYYNAEKKETYSLRLIPGPSRPVFITRIADGVIRMFVYSVSSGYGSTRVTTTTWFAEKDAIPLGEIKTGGLRGGKQDRKDFFRSLIADNPPLLKRFDEEEKYKIDFLEELIREYNKQAAGH